MAKEKNKKVEKDDIIRHPYLRGFSKTNWPQYKSEIQDFIQLLKDEGVTSYLEIGCRHGDSYHAVGKVLPKGSLVVGVDLPGARSGKETGGKFRDSYVSLQRAEYELNKLGQDAHVFIGNSHDSKIIKLVQKFKHFDAVFIDGDHSPDGVRADWENYGLMGDIVAFHDIYGKTHNPTNIMKLFMEVRTGKRWTEFAFNGLDRGIGVVWR